jgi:hypothetical protein
VPIFALVFFVALQQTATSTVRRHCQSSPFTTSSRMISIVCGTAIALIASLRAACAAASGVPSSMPGTLRSNVNVRCRSSGPPGPREMMFEMSEPGSARLSALAVGLYATAGERAPDSTVRKSIYTRVSLASPHPRPTLGVP